MCVRTEPKRLVFYRFSQDLKVAPGLAVHPETFWLNPCRLMIFRTTIQSGNLAFL